MLQTTRLYAKDGRSIGDIMPYFYQGVYHVYYLLNASSNDNIQLEHAYSCDLLRWEYAKPAVSRVNGPAWMLDTGNIFTCGLFTDGQDLHHMWYTSWNPDNPNGREFIQHAVSKDLFIWEKRSMDLLTPHPDFYSATRYRDFRDPCVIRHPGRDRYDMYILANPPWAENKNDYSDENWVFGHLESEDLHNWRQLPHLVAPIGDECPDYHCIQGKHFILAANRVYSAESADGPYDIVASGMDHPIARAGKTTFDGQRFLWFGGWVGQAMLMPREVFVDADACLSMRPIPEVRLAYQRHYETKISQGGHAVAYPPNVGVLIWAHVTFDTRLDVTVAFSNEMSVLLDSAQKKLVWTYGENLMVRDIASSQDAMSLEIYITGTMVEMFIDDRTAFSFSLPEGYPHECTLLSPYAQVETIVNLAEES